MKETTDCVGGIYTTCLNSSRDHRENTSHEDTTELVGGPFTTAYIRS